MTRTNLTLAGIVLLGLTSAASAQGRLGGPLSGYVFDSSAHALRPILGIPGASMLGETLAGAGGLTAAYIAPRQDLALAVGPDGASFLRLASGAATPVAFSLSTIPERVVFSPSGSTVALYSGGRVQVISGLPDAPALAAEYSIGAGTRAPMQFAARPARRFTGAFAPSDDGRYLLYSSGGEIRLLGAAGENFTVLSAGADALVAFAPGSHDAAVADPSGSGVVLLRNVAGAGSQTVLEAPAAGSASPAGLAFSEDGGKLFLALSSAHSISAYGLSKGGRTDVACDCEPSGLAPMGSLFRLNEAGAAPLWLLDARSAGLRVVFVPGLPE